MYNLFYFFCLFRTKKKQDLDEENVLNDCQDFLSMAGDLLINQQALILATSDEKGYDLDKYKKKVVENMEKQKKKGATSTQTCNEEQVNSVKTNDKKSFEDLMYGTEHWLFSKWNC